MSLLNLDFFVFGWSLVSLDVSPFHIPLCVFFLFVLAWMTLGYDFRL